VSRKRKKEDPREAAVPQEVLAEGSGPSDAPEAAASVDDLAHAAADVLDMDLEAQLDEIDPEDREAVEAHVVAVLEQSSDDDDELVFDTSDADATADAMRAEAEAELGEAEVLEADAAVEDDDELAAALPTTAASMDDRQLKCLVEALVFAADKPITLQRLRQLTRVSDVRRLEKVLADLATDYADRGVSLQQVSGGYLFRTNTQYSVWVQQLIAGRPVRLSRAQLETLAIIAYRQPITRPEVDEIRGVDSSATLRLLMDRSLIRILGRKEDVGRPILYGTTKEFLDFFSLGDLRELPTLREYSELTAESRKMMTDELGPVSTELADALAAAEGSSDADVMRDGDDVVMPDSDDVVMPDGDDVVMRAGDDGDGDDAVRRDGDDDMMRAVRAGEIPSRDDDESFADDDAMHSFDPGDGEPAADEAKEPPAD